MFKRTFESGIDMLSCQPAPAGFCSQTRAFTLVKATVRRVCVLCVCSMHSTYRVWCITQVCACGWRMCSVLLCAIVSPGGRFLTEPGDRLVASKPKRPSCLCSPCPTPARQLWSLVAIYVGTGDSNSSPRAVQQGLLPTEASP